MDGPIDPIILNLLKAGKFAVWRLDMVTAERLFAKARLLLEQIHGCQ